MQQMLRRLQGGGGADMPGASRVSQETAGRGRRMAPAPAARARLGGRVYACSAGRARRGTFFFSHSRTHTLIAPAHVPSFPLAQ
jgi:hypothetical protein